MAMFNSYFDITRGYSWWSTTIGPIGILILTHPPVGQVHLGCTVRHDWGTTHQLHAVCSGALTGDALMVGDWSKSGPLKLHTWPVTWMTSPCETAKLHKEWPTILVILGLHVRIVNGLRTKDRIEVLTGPKGLRTPFLSWKELFC